jgi:hypothetical protein
MRRRRIIKSVRQRRRRLMLRKSSSDTQPILECFTESCSEGALAASRAALWVPRYAWAISVSD